MRLPTPSIGHGSQVACRWLWAAFSPEAWAAFREVSVMQVLNWGNSSVPVLFRSYHSAFRSSPDSAIAHSALPKPATEMSPICHQNVNNFDTESSCISAPEFLQYGATTNVVFETSFGRDRRQSLGEGKIRTCSGRNNKQHEEYEKSPPRLLIDILGRRQRVGRATRSE